MPPSLLVVVIDEAGHRHEIRRQPAAIINAIAAFAGQMPTHGHHEIKINCADDEVKITLPPLVLSLKT
jgi:hypothetical protein